MQHSELIKSIKYECQDLNLLYVEDDLVLRESTELLLKKFFKSIDLAENGEDGLNLYKNKKYDIVITDIMMPKMNGREMSKLIKELNPQQAIIVMSAYEDSKYFLEFIDIGIHKFIPKPPVLDKIFNSIIDVAININNAKKVAKLSEQMKQDLHGNKELLSNIIDTIPVRIFWKDIDSKYLGCNTLFANDAGLGSEDDLIGKNDFELVWKNYAEEYVSDDKYVMQSNKSKVNYEEKQVTSDGDIIWLLTSKIPLKDEDEKVVGILGTYQDITERKKSEEELLTYKDKLEDLVSIRTKELESSISDLKGAQTQLIESEKMASLGSLVAGIAHEINTPLGLGLTGITHVQTITKDIDIKFKEKTLQEKNLKAYLEDVGILSESMRLSLVGAAELIRSFKQIAVDQNTEIKRDFYLHKYIDTVILSLHNILKKTDINITNNISDELKLYSYAGVFSQIFTNLINNSIIHGFGESKKGSIIIDTKIEDDNIKILYTDDGQGMNEHTAKHIFDPFFTTNMGQGGSGLGMNIVFNLITQKLNGTINLISEVGKGVKFEIDFSLKSV